MPKKKDFILIGVLLVIALIGLGVTQFLQHQTGASVTITIGGEIYGTYPLDQSRTIEINDAKGYNKVVIENGSVHMADADCPDQYCVQHAAIHASHVEVLIPFNFGIPGIKLGLANLVVVVALYLLNARQALMISVVRILLVSFTFGNMAALLYSIPGGLLSFAVMVLCRRIKGLSTMSVSVAGGISHNIGQILVAVFVVKNLNLLFYLPVLMIAGIITGLLIGLVAGLIIPSVRKALQL